jgi:DNA-binding PadR family transcriptional regulator
MPRSTSRTGPTAADVAAHLPLAPRDYLILFALTESARHGHGILKSVESQSDHVPFDPANLYRSLQKLQRHGLIAETDDDEPAAGPPRRCYELTRLGRAVLTAEAHRLTRLADLARARRLVAPPRGTP